MYIEKEFCSRRDRNETKNLFDYVTMRISEGVPRRFDVMRICRCIILKELISLFQYMSLMFGEFAGDKNKHRL